jgi:myo-inositol-1(or 4)-monophosphatase
MRSGNVLAGNPKVFGQLLQIIGPHLARASKTTGEQNQ